MPDRFETTLMKCIINMMPHSNIDSVHRKIYHSRPIPR